MVAMVFMIVLVVALGFYFKFSAQSVEESGQNACMVSNTVLLSSITSMSEIECSFGGKRSDCVDTSKLLVFDATRTYSSFFNTNCRQKVYFEQLYPVVANEICENNNYPDCSIYSFYDPGVQYTSSIKISTPVSLYYPLTDEYKFGKLIIEVLQ